MTLVNLEILLGKLEVAIQTHGSLEDKPTLIEFERLILCFVDFAPEF